MAEVAAGAAAEVVVVRAACGRSVDVHDATAEHDAIMRTVAPA